MPFELRQLRHVLALAEHGSFARAAVDDGLMTEDEVQAMRDAVALGIEAVTRAVVDPAIAPKPSVSRRPRSRPSSPPNGAARPSPLASRCRQC